MTWISPRDPIRRDCSVGGPSEHKEGRAWDWGVAATNAGDRRRIWASYRAEEGWRPYVGANPHTDHIHFSFSWAGARKQTSYWGGTPVTYTTPSTGQ